MFIGESSACEDADMHRRVTQHRACRPRLLLGWVLTSPAAIRAADQDDADREDLVARHQRGDWGDVPPGHDLANDLGCDEADDVVSGYRLESGSTIWVTTDGVRKFTAVTVSSERC